MKDNIHLTTLLEENSIVWLREQSQADNNSASELGREFLDNSNYTILTVPSNPLSWIFLFLKILKQDIVLYYQVSKPQTNILVALLIISKKTCIIHYLDNIVGGYPKWAKALQLDRIIYFLLSRASFTIFISNRMLRYFRRKLNTKGKLHVYYRKNPDSDFSKSSSKLDHDSCLAYLGAVNPKTNLAAIKSASKILNRHGFNLHIFTRSKQEIIADLNSISNIKVFSDIAPTNVVSVAASYQGILFPFNLDKHSQCFYRMSIPSKLPNMIMARRPMVYYGPKSFWLYSWFKLFPDYTMELETFVKSPHQRRTLIDKKEAELIYKSFVSSDL